MNDSWGPHNTQIKLPTKLVYVYSYCRLCHIYVEALGWFRKWLCIPWRKSSLCADIDPPVVHNSWHESYTFVMGFSTLSQRASDR